MFARDVEQPVVQALLEELGKEQAYSPTRQGVTPGLPLPVTTFA